jgi:hypothetical protein
MYKKVRSYGGGDVVRGNLRVREIRSQSKNVDG